MSLPIAPGARHPSSTTQVTDNKLSNQTTPARRLESVDFGQVDPKLLKAAQGMEEMFIDQMMQVMRKTVPESEYTMENGATKLYRSLLDSHYSKKAAQAGGVGLAELIIDYMHTSGYNVRRRRPYSNTPPHSEGVSGSEKESKIDLTEGK